MNHKKFLATSALIAVAVSPVAPSVFDNTASANQEDVTQETTGTEDLTKQPQGGAQGHTGAEDFKKEDTKPEPHVPVLHEDEKVTGEEDSEEKKPQPWEQHEQQLKLLELQQQLLQQQLFQQQLDNMNNASSQTTGLNNVLEYAMINAVKTGVDKALTEGQTSVVVLKQTGFEISILNKDKQVISGYTLPLEVGINSLFNPTSLNGGVLSNGQNTQGNIFSGNVNDLSKVMTVSEAKQANRFITMYGEKLWVLDSDKLAHDKTINVYSRAKLMEYSKETGLNFGKPVVHTVGMMSNDDGVRRAELEKILGVTLTDTEVWNNGEGKVHTDIYGREVTNTSVRDLKAQGNYATNANRQEAIMVGINTGNWQPSREIQARENPLYFTRDADNKLQYSKLFYATTIERLLTNFRATAEGAYFVTGMGDTRTKEEYIKDHHRELQEAINSYKQAKGPEVYVFGFNSNEEYATKYGVGVVPIEYFISPYNNPNVKSKGTFE